MLSIGLKIEPSIRSGLLRFYSARPSLANLELHFISIKKIIEEFKPEIIVLDPVTNLMSEGINSEIRQLLTHFVDYLKSKKITTLFTAAITLETIKSNPSDEGISAMVDTWVLLRDIESNNERNRGINILKSRGMNHSTQVREFVITENGITILPIYLSPQGVLTGSAKLEHTLRKEEEDKVHENQLKNQKSEIARRRRMLGGETALLKAGLESEIADLNTSRAEYDLKEETEEKNKTEIINLRSRTRSSSEKSKGRNK